jgi:subtilisin family serine protease
MERKRGAYRSGRRVAVVAALVAASVGLGQLGVVLISDAEARSNKNRAGKSGTATPSSQQQRPAQALQAIQQLRAAQQAAQTQQKLQAVQSTIAAQQQHVQRIQQMTAAARHIQRPNIAPPAAASATSAGKTPQQRPHQALVQRALSQVQAGRQAASSQVASNRIQAMRNVVAKVRGHQTTVRAPQTLSSGRHHSALLQSVASRMRQPSHSIRSSALGGPRTKHNAVLSHVMAKLRGGPSLRGPHQVRQQVVFKHIFGKLSHRFKKKADPAPAPTPVATPAPTTTPATTKSQTAAMNTLPKLPDSTPDTSLVTAALSIVKSASGSINSTDSSNSKALNGTMSKLGGPAQAKDDDDDNGRGNKTIRKVDRNDDDASAGGSKKSTQSGARLVNLQPLESLPAHGSFNPRQILAVDLGDNTLKVMLGRQFKKIDEFPIIGGSKLTQLETPPNADALKSMDLLKDIAPDTTFALNRLYAPYRLGASGRPSTGGITSPGGGCSGDRCFGANLINWQPAAAACTQGVKIGIVDTGYDERHPAFANTSVEPKAFVPKGAFEAPKDHGTGILSVLGGGLATSTPGLAPNAKYFFAKAFYAETSGGPPVSDTAEMMAALNWLVDMDVRIVNLSFAGPIDPIVHYTIQEMTSRGIVVVAAAGNEGPNAPPAYPAAYKEVIAVTAVDRNLAPYRYANRGAHIDIAAPGVGIWTALPGRKEGQQTGTSFAVPYVTAVLAMNHTQLAGLRNNPFAPKERAVEILNANVMRLGGPATQRSPIFGTGLVQAPSNCPPASGVAVAANTPRPAAESAIIPISTKTQKAAPPRRPVSSLQQQAPAPASLGDWDTKTTPASTVDTQRR